MECLLPHVKEVSFERGESLLVSYRKTTGYMKVVSSDALNFTGRWYYSHQDMAELKEDELILSTQTNKNLKSCALANVTILAGWLRSKFTSF